MNTRSLRLAMWSGPRNISTAMMRSWGNRADTFVSDEPLYAHYLAHTRKAHPGADEIIACGETDWRQVVAQLTGPIPGGKTIWFQKHMTHHLLPHLELDWIDRLTNCFLIRDPREMLTSLLRVFPEANLADTGLRQQVSLFERVRAATGKTPPVLDSRDVLRNPRGELSKLCATVGVELTEAMLHWPAGRRHTDGIWAKHWYGRVEQTTGFEPPLSRDDPVPEERKELLKECEELYRTLYQHRLK
jgi:hypothetical protein